MKKIYSFLMACVLGASALTATAERRVEAMTNRGVSVTSLDQLTTGAKVLFRATSRDGYLFENVFSNNQNKLWLSRGVPASGTSSYYLFTIEDYTNNGSEATFTLKTPKKFSVPELVSGSSPVIDENSVSTTFTLTKANITDPAEGDSIWYIMGQNGMYFNGNQLNSSNPLFGTYGTFAGWNQTGENSKYQIFLPEVEEKTLYTVTVTGVDVQSNGLYDPKTYEVGLNDSILLPTVAGYHIDLESSYLADNTPLVVSNNYVKVTGDMDISLSYVLNDLLFTPINGTDTTWYFLKIRDNYYCYYNPETNAGTAEGAVPTSATADNKNPDAYLWAFAGDRENGFRLINKKAGNSLVLTAADVTNGAANYLASADEAADFNTYMYGEPVNGKFYLQLKDIDNAYINQFGGANGKLRFWVDGSSKTDAGSHFKVVKYDADSVKKVVFDAKLATFAPYIQSEGYVNGWTAEQLADLKTAVSAKDTTAADAALAVLVNQPKIAFDATKTYAIVSAYNRLQGDNAGKKFALAYGDTIATGDSLRRMTWSELPANIQDADAPAGYKWKFTEADAARNVNELERLYSGDDDSMHVFYAIENQLLSSSVVAGQNTKMYVGDFQYGKKVPMVISDEKFKMYLQVTKTPAVFSILGFHVGQNSAGETTYTRVGLNPTGFSNTATQGYVQSANTLWVSGANTSAFYLLEVTAPSANAVTGVSSVEATKAAQAGTIYDLTGRKVSKAQKGLYIINGQKAVVK